MKNVILPFVICTIYEDDNFVRIVTLIAITGKDEITLAQKSPNLQYLKELMQWQFSLIC